MRVPHVWAPGDTLKEVQRDIIISALSQHDGNMNKTAEAVGIPRATLYKRVLEYGIDLYRLRQNYGRGIHK